MIDFTEIDEANYLRASAELRTAAFAHFRDETPVIAEPVKTSGVSLIGPVPDGAVLGEMHRCLDCPTMVDGRRLRCPICAPVARLRQNIETQRVRREKKRRKA